MEAHYTVFAKWNDGSDRHGKQCYFPTFKNEKAQTITERIEYVRNYFGKDSFLPVAWTIEHVGYGDFERLMAESIAAGRAIELIDGKYVPRGVPVEAPKPAATERTRPALTWATPKPVDRFEGYIVTSGSNDVLHTLFDGVHPLQRMTEPSDQLHGSAFLRKG